MTFTEIVTQVTEDLNLTATAAVTRVGRQVNIRYKRIVSTLGLDTSARTSSTQNPSVGSTEVTFTSIDKITRIADITDGTVKLLKEVTWDELREESPPSSDSPTRYAIKRAGATSVVVVFDVNFQTTTPSLRADGYETTSTLSGSTAPAFPEDFHDILVWGAKADELLKMEKASLSKHCEERFEKRLSELRLYLAKSNYLDRRQGARQATQTSATGGGSGSSGTIGETSYTQTGLITFDRDPSAPFAVTNGSAVVTNLDADKLDGLDSTAFARSTEDYLVKTASANLSAERVVTDNTDITADWSVAGVVKFLLGAFTGDITKTAGSLATTIAAGAVTEAKQTLADNTTNDVTSTKHGYAPKSPADATKFLNGAATPAYALVKDSDLSTSDITTNDVSTSKHGFAPKAPNDATKFLDGTGAYSVPAGGSGYDYVQLQSFT